MTQDTQTAPRDAALAGPAGKLFIDGELQDAADGGVFETIEPATGSVLAEVSHGRAEDIDRAVKAARRALDGPWGRMTLKERSRLLLRLAGAIEERTEEFAVLEARDAGKAIRDARAQVGVAIDRLSFFADIAEKLRSSVIPNHPGYLNYTLRQPVGVVGAISPWNYPLPQCATKLSAPLAMGNTIVFKPAEQTPLTALAVAELSREVGFPEGVINVVTGGGETAGRPLVEHPGVDMISFTGSTVVGRDIAARAGAMLKRVTLELGGKSPNIVFADADLDAAAATSLFTFSVHSGQLCSAGSRLLIQDAVREDFVGGLVDRAGALRVGDPLDPETQLGAVISQEQMDRIEYYVRSGEEGGAVRLTGGRRLAVPGLDGLFFTPTIFGDVRSEMTIAQEEIFGPVLSVISFKDEEDAIRIANDVSYGLAAGIWTRDVGRAHRVAERVEAGLVYVNTMNVLSPNSPYEGWKGSGMGTEGGFEQAMDVTRLKSVWVNHSGSAPVL